jgi:hypothetical protein
LPPTATPLPPSPTPVALATATPSPAPTPAATPAPSGVVIGFVTPYSDSLHGNTLGCGGAYDMNDPSIVAVSFARDMEWGCGKLLEITGPNGKIVGVRRDTCPGCSENHLDLSRAGFNLVCGPNASSCEVTIRLLP